MHACPHCGARSISTREKVKSSRFVPASCLKCQGESYVAPWWRWIAAFGSELLVAGTVFAVILLGVKGLVLSAILFVAFLALVTFLPKLIPLRTQPVHSFTWPMSRALISSTVITFALVGGVIWALISRAK
jgi:hypothetical protein